MFPYKSHWGTFVWLSDRKGFTSDLHCSEVQRETRPEQDDSQNQPRYIRRQKSCEAS